MKATTVNGVRVRPLDYRSASLACRTICSGRRAAGRDRNERGLLRDFRLGESHLRFELRAQRGGFLLRRQIAKCARGK